VTITLLQQQKFELLFEIGAFAITDGYYREAVSSFTSSMERFYEFFIKVVFADKGIPETSVVDSWKKVTKQSERQLGAFIFLYTSEFGESPKVLVDKEVQFRNEVIHKGKIPSRQEALNYGQVVLDLVRPVLQKLNEKYPKGIQHMIWEHLNQSRKKSDEMIGTMSISTIISVNRKEVDNRSLEEAIKEMLRWR